MKKKCVHSAEQQVASLTTTIILLRARTSGLPRACARPHPDHHHHHYQTRTTATSVQTTNVKRLVLPRVRRDAGWRGGGGRGCRVRDYYYQSFFLVVIRNIPSGGDERWMDVVVSILFPNDTGGKRGGGYGLPFPWSTNNHY